MEGEFPTRLFKCSACGKEKRVIMNHDGLKEIWERCVDDCGWLAKEGPVIMSAEGEPTGFRKRKFIKVEENKDE